MAVSDLVQTFAGITNENEFYSHHYLSEVFSGDIRALLQQWKDTEEKGGAPSPSSQLRSLSRRWKQLFEDVKQTGARASEKRSPDDALQAISLHRALYAEVIEALGYTLLPQEIELEAGCPVPIWTALDNTDKPRLVILPAFQPGRQEADPLDQHLTPTMYGISEVPPKLKGRSFAEIISDALFGAENPPRFVLVVGLSEWLLLDRLKWSNNRTLRFDWEEILNRRDAQTLDAACALLHREALAPASGQSLLDNLDENAHKHALKPSNFSGRRLLYSCATRQRLRSAASTRARTVSIQQI